MLRKSFLVCAPKPNGFGGIWSTLQSKGMKEAGSYAKSYAKNFTKSQQGQNIYKKMAQTTAAIEMKAKGTFNHYWQAFHEMKSNIKTGPSGESNNNNNTNNNANNNTSNGSSTNNENNSSSADSNSNSNSGGGRTFYQKMEDFWRNNKEYIISFIAANFMGVIFAIQFGGQIWSLVSGLWAVYWHNVQAKRKKIEEDKRREAARRSAQEEHEDALDDVYGGSDDGLSAQRSKQLTTDSTVGGTTVTGPSGASATAAAVDEDELRRRLARREERRRRKELEATGLVMHDDTYSQREERRQASAGGLGGAVGSSRALEKEEPRVMSGMEMLATQLLQQEENEQIEGALSSVDSAGDAEKARAAQQLFWRQQVAQRNNKNSNNNNKKELTRREKRKVRKEQREKEMQTFFKEREARLASAGGRASTLSSSSSSSNNVSAAATARHRFDEAANASAYADSFSYTIEGQEPVSFAQQYDASHEKYGTNGAASTLKKLWNKALGKEGGEGDTHVFDFTSSLSFGSVSDHTNSTNNNKRRRGGPEPSGVHDFTS